MMCRITRTREWSIRIMHELDHWNAVGSFVTLTYDEEHVPINTCPAEWSCAPLVKDHLTRYIKRLRKSLGKNKIRYYAVGEYGEKHNRPHYHLIIFGLGPESEEIDEAWKYGIVYKGDVSYKSAQYVAAYVQKKLYGKREKEYGDKIPPYSVMSKGLGKAFCDENSETLVDTLSVTINGKPAGLPRYYRKRLGDRITEERLLMERLARGAEREERHEKRGIDKVSEAIYTIKQREQKEEDLKALEARRKRKL